MLKPPENERYAVTPQSRIKTALRAAFFGVFMAASATAYGAPVNSPKSKDESGIESKICGLSGFFSVIEEEGKKFIVMHSGCTTYNGKKAVKAEFTHNSDMIIEANENAEFMISEDMYIFFINGEPVLSYIDENNKRINLLLKKQNGVYNMRKYLRYMK